jgi:hypothetical protein
VNWKPFPYPIPRSEWPGPGRRLLPPAHTQALQKRCVCEAATADMEWEWVRQGNEPIRLDAVELFSRVEDVAQGGTQPGTVFEEIRANGVKSLTGTGRYSAEWWVCEEKVNGRPKTSFDLAYSAVLHDRALVIALDWRTGNQVAPDGWLKEGPAFLSFGHCVFGYAAAQRLTKNQPEFGIWCVQSQGSFSPKTSARVVISEAQLKTAAFYVCQSVSAFQE